MTGAQLGIGGFAWMHDRANKSSVRFNRTQVELTGKPETVKGLVAAGQIADTHQTPIRLYQNEQ